MKFYPASPLDHLLSLLPFLPQGSLDWSAFVAVTELSLSPPPGYAFKPLSPAPPTLRFSLSYTLPLVNVKPSSSPIMCCPHRTSPSLTLPLLVAKLLPPMLPCLASFSTPPLPTSCPPQISLTIPLPLFTALIGPLLKLNRSPRLWGIWKSVLRRVYVLASPSGNIPFSLPSMSCPCPCTITPFSSPLPLCWLNIMAWFDVNSTSLDSSQTPSRTCLISQNWHPSRPFHSFVFFLFRVLPSLLRGPFPAASPASLGTYILAGCIGCG